jgi:hypothetical protein
MISDLGYWQPVARPLVERFGYEAVHQASKDYLGFPGWMIHCYKEVVRLDQILTKKNKDKDNET